MEFIKSALISKKWGQHYLEEHRSRFCRDLTSKANPIILAIDKKNMDSYEQEEYIALHGHRESEMVKTRSSAVMEWACKLKSKRSALV